MRALSIGFVALLLAACGGGESDLRSAGLAAAAATSAAPPVIALAQAPALAAKSDNPSAKALAALAKPPKATQSVWGGLTPAAAADQLMDFAERVYGASNPTLKIFPTHETSYEWGGYRYRYYPATGVFIAVAVSHVEGDGLVLGHAYVLGGPFGFAPIDIGPLTGFIVPGVANWSWSDVLGTYSQPGSAGGWSRGTVTLKDGKAETLLWTNDAGFSWTLTPDYVHGVLALDPNFVYASLNGGKNFALEFASGGVSGFTFLGNVYAREVPGALAASTGMGSYINLDYDKNQVPADYAYGFSLYTAIWPTVDGPLDNFQIGYPGTWLNANNDDYPFPLVPPTHPFAGSPYDPYSRLFQTIEGSAGYWSSTRFPSSSPKYRINGTPNGYGNELSSPGWGFGSDALAPGEGTSSSLPMGSSGVAQLSNRLLMPPDGWTFAAGTSGEVLGVAWMALPLTEAKTGATPVGDQSWTAFVNAANFQGPAAFYLPDVWTVLSRTYPTANGRGLDARPATISHFAMEYGHMPFFQAPDKSGTSYVRLPKLTYPTDSNSASILASDFSLYSKAAIFQPLSDWLHGGAAITGKFSASGRVVPSLQAQPVYMWKGGTDIQMATQQGLSDYFTPTVVQSQSGGSAWAFQWKNAAVAGTFPQYFKKQGDYYRPVDVADVPAETGLTTASFSMGGRGQSIGAFYTSPATWNSPAPVAGPYSAELNDGSTVTYSWYRFIDQPSLQGFGWSDAEKQKLQSVIEKLHGSWASTQDFMAPPSFSSLATLDAGLLVTPPPGLEIGYVPVVTRQSR